MDIERICCIFEELSGISPDECPMLIQSAAEEVRAMLIDDTDRFRDEICCLAAALANLRKCEFDLSRDKHAVTAGGGVSSVYPDNARLENARSAYNRQKKLCLGYIRDDGFVFFGARG